MKLRHAIRRVPEALLMALGLLLVPWLPRRAVLWLARVAGRAGAVCARGLRRVALANLELAYGDTLARAEKERILRQSFAAMARVVLDVFWFSFFTRTRVQRWVSLEPSMRHLFETCPSVNVTAHLGNWEVLGLAVACRGAPLHSVATPLKNALADRLMHWIRRRTGQRIVPRRGAVRSLMRVLAEGGRVAVLMDQNTLPAEGGEFVSFFGVPVPVSKAASALARRAGCATVFSFCVADEAGRYRAYSLPPVAAGEIGTRRVAETVEREVRRHPGQWLWMYKRWKYASPDAGLEEYPFYARPAPG